MASPLSMFRKYQYSILVVMGVILMISFLIVPLVTDYQTSRERSGGIDTETAAVTWNGGRYREVDLTRLFRAHQQLHAFLEAVQKETEKKEGQSKVMPPPARGRDEDLVAMTLLAKKARDMGVVLSDGALRHYIDLLCDESLDHEELNRLLNEATSGELTYSQLMAQLREELLALYAEEMRQSAAVASTPAQNFESYAKLHRRAVLEMLPLPIDDYVAQVKDEPKESEIKDLYEKYKTEYPNPNSPEPGFRQPEEIDFAYLKLDFNKLLEQEKTKITEQQIQAEYDKGLSRGDYRIPQLPPPISTPQEIQNTTIGERPPAPPDDANHTDKTPDETTTPESGETSETDSTPDSPAPQQPDESEPAQNTDQPNDTDEPGNDGAPQNENEETTENPPGCTVVALQDDPTEDEPAADDTAAQNTAAQNTAADDTAADDDGSASDADTSGAQDASQNDAAQGDAGESADQSGEEQPTTEQPSTSTADDPQTATDSVPKNPLGTAATPPELRDLAPINEMPSALDERIDEPIKKRQHKTLEEVRESILRKLASPPAQVRMDKLLSEARQQLDTYYRKYLIWEQSEDSTRSKPVPPRETDLATQYGFEAGRTGAVNFLDVVNTELGKLRAPPPEENPLQQGREFRMVAYNPSVLLYDPMGFTRNDDPDMHYIVWKVAITPEKIPSLKEAREDVVTAWKRAQARKLVVREAESLSKAAKEGEGNLYERLPAHTEKIFITNEFPWLTSINAQFAQFGIGPYDISPVENVEVPTEEFMETVFSKKPNEVGMVKNAGESVYYVFRVQRLVPADETLRERFLMDFRSADSFQAMSIAQLNATEYVNNLNKDLFDEFNVKWNVESRNHMQ